VAGPPDPECTRRIFRGDGYAASLAESPSSQLSR